MSEYGWSSDPQKDRELFKQYGATAHQICARTLRSWKIMTRNTGAALGKWIPKEVLWDCTRVDGRAVCETCKLPFYDHPEVAPTFHLGCDQKILKT